jgi:hypothetical protein
MSRGDLISDLKASLLDAANAFTAANDADFSRHLDKAADALTKVHPRLKTGTLPLVSGSPVYDAPDDLIGYRSELWFDANRIKPWDPGYPGPAPIVTLAEREGGFSIVFDPAPSYAQVGLFGSTFTYHYHAQHRIGDDAADTTIRPGDRGLLLLRAQAEALLELSIRNVNKPVSLRDGTLGTPRNGTPAALFQVLLQQFKEAA